MANKESSEAAKKIAKAEKEKTAKKPKKDKKNIFKAIARFFKDLKGETKKIIIAKGSQESYNDYTNKRR